MITIPRFEPFIEEKGVKLQIDSKSVVLIKDHTTDKVIGMINLSKISDDNLDLAEDLIETIENWITENEKD
jgi:hypothetical protein